MTVQKLYEDFRARFPEPTHATDVLHAEGWTLGDDLLLYLWFEDLARVLNVRMGVSDFQSELDRIFAFFDGQWGAGSAEVQSCIDTNLVENLFWEVPSKRVRNVWPIMPTRLQRLYVDFHGKPPNMS